MSHRTLDIFRCPNVLLHGDRPLFFLSFRWHPFILFILLVLFVSSILFAFRSVCFLVRALVSPNLDPRLTFWSLIVRLVLVGFGDSVCDSVVCGCRLHFFLVARAFAFCALAHTWRLSGRLIRLLS